MILGMGWPCACPVTSENVFLKRYSGEVLTATGHRCHSLYTKHGHKVTFC